MSDDGDSPFEARVGGQFQQLTFEATILTEHVGVAIYTDSSEPEVGIQIAAIVRGLRQDLDTKVETSFMLTERLACGLIAQLMYTLKRAGANDLVVEHLIEHTIKAMKREFG